MNDRTKSAYAEVVTIINLLDVNFRDKIPSKLMEVFENEKDPNHVKEIDPDVPLEEQNLLQETIDVLALLKLNYWCFEEGEKQELLDLLNENERKYQEELREKYNPDNIFKKKDTIVEEQTAMVEHKKPSFVTTILERIRSLFSSKGK
ncbi:MAG: hypothetical protein FWC79_01425 [Oscillospiraceae bacterium]|nr:hypothetical protein [Oscillospiraceae bacterium]